MSGYTSGRSVKSVAARKSPIAAATAEARRLVRRHLPQEDMPVIKSEAGIFGTDGVRRMKTTILFRELDRSVTKPLADAIEALGGYHSMAWNAVSITYLRGL